MFGPSPLIKKTPDVICIIGMHRSGTSMVARLLNLCGLDLGPAGELLGPDPGNPLGHFEHTGFLNVNNGLLSYFGGSAYAPPDLKPGWQHDPSLERFVHEAQLLISKFSGSHPWGWKEPRTTILLPFWKAIIPNLHFVICARSPLEVARSLAKRQGMPLESAVYLWNSYMRASIRDTEGCPRIFTFYEDYFRGDSDEIGRIVNFCGLEKLDDASQLQAAISGELRHHASETWELLDEPGIATEYKLLYIGLRALSVQRFVSIKCGNAVKNSTSEDVDKLLRLINELHSKEKVVQLEMALAEKTLQLMSAQATIETKLQEKEQQRIELQAKIAELGESNTRLQAFADAVRRSLIYRVYRTVVKPLMPE